LANSKELAGKATVRVVIMMKQEAINVAFGGANLCLLRTSLVAPCRRARSLQHRAGTLLRWSPTCLSRMLLR
jgi:hypothetical protein